MAVRLTLLPDATAEELDSSVIAGLPFATMMVCGALLLAAYVESPEYCATAISGPALPGSCCELPEPFCSAIGCRHAGQSLISTWTVPVGWT